MPMTRPFPALLAAGLCVLCAGPASARPDEVKVDLTLGWEDDVYGARGGLETAVFPRIVLSEERLIVTTTPSMAPSSVRDRLASCGQSATVDQFMSCRHSAGPIMGPPQNAAVIFPAAGGAWKCSSSQLLNGKQYRVCASVQVKDPRHLLLDYALESTEANTIVTRKVQAKLELDSGRCTTELVSAQRTYLKFPGRVFAMTRPSRPVCNYSF
jgi:hypothetical protein